MKNNIFIHFTIKGDNLDLKDIQKLIPISTCIFKKNETYEQKIIKDVKPQSTNRWVYSKEFINTDNLNCCVNQIANEMNPYLKEIKFFTKRYNSLFEIVIYVSKETSIFNTCLSKKSMKFLSEINAKVNLTFIDF